MPKSRSPAKGPSIAEIRAARQVEHDELMARFYAFRDMSIARGVKAVQKDHARFAVLFGYAEGKRKRRLDDAQE